MSCIDAGESIVLMKIYVLGQKLKKNYLKNLINLHIV